jgi:hypothetical protein
MSLMRHRETMKNATGETPVPLSSEEEIRGLRTN